MKKALIGSVAVIAAMVASTSIAQTGAAAARHDQRPVVQTTDGAVRGNVQDKVNVFLGIPYAAPPVGELRWKPPQPAVRWSGTRDASRYASSCAQVTTFGVFAGPTSVEEDCLYLNIFTTATGRAEKKKPVFVWFHGGGNIDGASNDYDGSKLATGGPDGSETVVVTLNYRLGMFGIFSHPAIDKGELVGNYNILDQQAALRWVQRNIAAFGGDPANVTIGGQSAGNGDTGSHMISPLSAGLFHRSILQSSPGFIAWLPTKDATTKLGTAFAAAAGCTGADAAVAACLRTLSTARILQVQGTLKAGNPYHTNYPYVDGTIIPITPEEAWSSGRFNRVPVLGGATRDEVTFFNGIPQYFAGPPQAPMVTPANYSAMTAPGQLCIFCNIERRMPPGIAELYPLSDHGDDAMLAYQRIGSDAAKCRELHVLEKLQAHVPVYAYDFSYQNAPYYFPKMPGFKPLAAHTIDIQFLFPGFHGGHLGVNVDQQTGMPRELDAAETKLSDVMVAAWTRFAATGNPNGSGDAPWPRFRPGATGQYFVQDIPVATRTVAQVRSAHRCDFFDAQLKY